MSIGVGIELHGRRSAAASSRHFDNAGCAPNTERRRRRCDLHVAGLGDKAGDESRRTACHIKQGVVAAAILLVNESVDHDARIGGEAESRLVIKADAQRRIDVRLQDVLYVNHIGDLQRHAAGIAARHRCIARNARNLADGIIRRCRRSGLI
jgi:hypothetical protein